MNGASIFEALASHALAMGPTASAGLGLAATPTGRTFEVDESSNRIYAALLEAAQGAQAEQMKTHVLAPIIAGSGQEGFFTAQLHALGTPVVALASICLIGLGLALTTVGARSLLWGNKWGKKRGTHEGRAWFSGGLGGLALGAITFGTFAAALISAIVSRQTDPKLGKWGTLVVLVASALLGAPLIGRWRFTSRLAIGLLGGTAGTTMLVASSMISDLLIRAVLLAVAIPIAAVFATLPKTTNSLALLSAAIGAWLFVLGVDAAVRVGFLDLVGLLVAPNGAAAGGKPLEVPIQWDKGAAKGMLAAWWIMTIAGAAFQWWQGGFAGDTDAAWNTYLSSFVKQRPSHRGSFEPPRSIFDRVFRRPSSPLTDLPSTYPQRRRNFWNDEKESEWDEASADDADVATLVGSAGSKEPAKYGKVTDADEESTIGDFALKRPVPPRYKTTESMGEGAERLLPAETATPARWNASPPTSPSSSTPAGAVAATPSLLNALERINKAQREAKQGGAADRAKMRADGVLIPQRSIERQRGQSWDEWWAKVHAKSKEDTGDE